MTPGRIAILAGIAVLALAEELGRPYRILVNSDFMKLPEIRPHALPIDFSESREAIATNLKSAYLCTAAVLPGPAPDHRS